MTRRLTIRDIETAIELRDSTTMTWRQIGAEIAKRKGRAVAYLENTMQHACKPFMKATNPEK